MTMKISALRKSRKSGLSSAKTEKPSRNFCLAAIGAVTAILLLVPSTISNSRPNSKPLYQKTYKEIIANYTFINDFGVKEPEREVSSELFWRYPLKVPKVNFPIDFEHDSVTNDLPRTMGTGRAFEHLNKGRLAYIAKDFETAKNTFLTARAKFGRTFNFHRRNDYFIGISFMQLAERRRLAIHGNYDDDEVRSQFANAATFLSWAFIRKRDFPDPLLKKLTPKFLYNLAAVYFKYERFAGAHGAATTGLNYLRGSGESGYRPQFRRMVAEGWIKNRSYLKAVQVLDTAVREDPDPEQAASAFARVGDIYFDLNNYELAEDAYGLSIAIDREKRRINAAQMILRGESLFWLGRFSDSQKMLAYGLKGVNTIQAVSLLPMNYAAWAKLRLSDGYLARAEQLKGKKNEREKKELIQSAKLSYFQVESNYPGSEAAKIAKIRRACLELPFYAGKNVGHARSLLEKSKTAGLPSPAIELSWACKTASYAQRERTKSMIDRVRAFANLYPESRFLMSLADPVRETQISTIDTFFKSAKRHKAVLFFEQNRKVLFREISQEHKVKLFEAYVDIFRSEKAQEFWPAYAKTRDTHLKLIRSAIFASEISDLTKSKKSKDSKKWKALAKSLILQLNKVDVKLAPTSKNKIYINRAIATSFDSEHLKWTYRLVSKWTRKEKKYACEMKYPLLSKIVIKADGGKKIKEVVPAVLAAVDEHLPGLLEIDFNCGSSLLELESQVLVGDVSKFKSRWLGRLNWPLVPQIVKHLWGAAESLAGLGEKKAARKIWKHLSQNGPKDLAEVKYSRLRLDKNKTEFEGLWK